MYRQHSGIPGNIQYRPDLSWLGTYATESFDAIRRGDLLSDGHYLGAATLAETLQQAGFPTITAAALVQRVMAHIGMLAEHPRLGSRIPELLPKSRYRQIVESPCRVFYGYEPATGSCYIFHVIRGEKLFQKRLLFQHDLKT